MRRTVIWTEKWSQSLLKSGHFRASGSFLISFIIKNSRNPFLNQVIFEGGEPSSIIELWKVAIPS